MQQSKQYRMFHWLKKNVRTDSPQSMLFVDCESYVNPIIGTKVKCEEHTLRLWCAAYCRMEKDNVTREKNFDGYREYEFWDIIYGRGIDQKPMVDDRRKLWIFAHNLSYDATMLKLWREFDEGRLTLCTSDADEESNYRGTACIAGPPTFIECRVTKSKATIVFVDTLNWFRTSLYQLGDSIGIKKLDMPDWKAGDIVWFEYCKQDVEIIKQSMIALAKLVRNDDLGHFAVTAPGQAWNAYRHRFMKEKYILISGNEEQLEMERDAYFGGSVKSYFVGDVVQGLPVSDLERKNNTMLQAQINGPIYVLDIQSFWPSIMKEIDLPRAVVSYCKNPTLKDVELATELYSVVAKVWIQSDKVDFPKRFETCSNMCRGEFWTTLCTPELRLALETESILHCESMYIYKRANLFKEYVDHFWNMRVNARNDNDFAKAELAKLFLNSLLGKFGQRPIRWQDCPEVCPGVPWGEWSEWNHQNQKRENYRSLAWLCQIKVTEGESDNSFPAIPATVTSEGRVRMREYERIAGECNCLYSDTDSLHVTEEGFVNIGAAGLIEDGSIGKFCVKGKYERASYFGPKSYCLDNKLTVAGLSKNATYILPGLYEQPEFPSLQQLFADYKHLAMIVPYSRKTIRYSNMLGRVQWNGRVNPLILGEKDLTKED